MNSSSGTIDACLLATMNHRPGLLLLIALAVFACGRVSEDPAGGRDACPMGTELCPCHNDGSCHAGLSCGSGLCVLVADGSGGTDPEPAGWAGSASGVASGGAPQGGASAGGVASGGAPTGGVPSGGTWTGGSSTGGVSSGGVSTGGAPTGGVATGGSATGGLGASCLYDGVIYSDGDSFTATDHCNQCGCANGLSMCTQLNCTAGCTATMGVGAAYYRSNGCEYCVCDRNGTESQVVCTAASPCVVCDDDGVTHYPGDAWTKSCATCNCTDTEVNGVVVGEVVCLETC